MLCAILSDEILLYKRVLFDLRYKIYCVMLKVSLLQAERILFCWCFCLIRSKYLMFQLNWTITSLKMSPSLSLSVFLLSILHDSLQGLHHFYMVWDPCIRCLASAWKYLDWHILSHYSSMITSKTSNSVCVCSFSTKRNHESHLYKFKFKSIFS